MKNDPQQTEQESAERDALIGRAFLWSLLGFALLGGGVAGAVWWMQREPDPGEDKQTRFAPAVVTEQQDAPIPDVRFVDVTREAGIEFVHENGADGEVLWPELTGSGCALFDFDGDGRLDILFVNSKRWPWSLPKEGKRPTHELYRNLGDMKFENATQAANLEHSFYGHGAAVGDYDNDGDPDLFISGTQGSRLYRNNGGRFEDVTTLAGVGGDRQDLSTSAGWLDYDNDGDLDLFVLNYLVWSREIDLTRSYRSESGVAPQLGPQQYQGDQCSLYRNEGQGLFTDVSEPAGIHVVNPDTGEAVGRALAVCFADLNRDHWIDIVVANDTTRNFAFLNQRDGTFKESGEKIGVAVGPYGKARAGMGVDIADIRGDNTQAIAIGNFGGEMSGLFINSQAAGPNALLFSDEAIAAGIGAATRKPLTFSVLFFDYDLDGRLDFMQTNGHVNPVIDKQTTHQHAQPDQLFWNCGPDGKFDFAPVTAEHLGEDFFRPMVGRGAAYGDLDGDGDLDLVVTSTGFAARVYRNDQQLKRHWVRIKLEGVRANRDAIGAMLHLRVGDQVLHRQVSPTRGFLSQSELAVTFGLGDQEEIGELRVVWPGGEEQVARDLRVDQLNIIRQADPK